MSKVANKPVAPVARRIRKVSRTESECSRGEEEEECLSPDEDGYSICELPMPQPPDGGYGWVIVLASFMCNMIVDGIAYTFGIFLGELADHFGEGRGTTAWVGSLLSGMYLCAGPVVSALTDKYGCRAVCIAGAIISTISFVLCIFSPSVYVMMLTYGIMGGFGFGLIYLPAVVCVGFYFEQKRCLATGIAVAGSGLGAFAFAPLATILLDKYGWEGANLILAGFILNCAVFGMMMRPLKYEEKEGSGSGEKPLLQRMADEKRLQMERGSIGGSYFMVQLPDGSMEKRVKIPINIDPGVHSSFNLDQLSGTPMTTNPTLPTISEAKGTEHGGSSAGSSESGDSKNDKKKARQSADAEPKPEDSTEVPKMPRNASQPAFTTHVPLPKNVSVPFFDRIRKTSQGERFRPTLQPIHQNTSSRGNVSNGDLRKSLHLKLSTSSFADSNKNNNFDDDGDNESMGFTASKVSLRMRKELARPMSRKDIFYSGSIVNLPEYQSQKSLTGYRMSVVSLPRYGSQAANMSQRDVEQGPPPDLCPCLALPEGFKTILSTMLDFTLLKDPVFLLVCISNVFGMAGLYVPFVYLVDAAVMAGVDQSSASFLLSIIGVTNTFGRVACGYAADFESVDSVLLNNICLVISTISVAYTPFCTTYTEFIIMSVFFGFAVSGYISLTSIILVDLLGGVDKLTTAFGLLIMFRGVAAMVGTPIAGAVYDATQSYSTSFFIAAIFFALSAAFSFAARPVKRWLTPPERPHMQDALTPIDEDEEEEDEEGEDMDEDGDDRGIIIPEITKTAASPATSKEVIREIEQLESVL